jgi:hypothetical protein
MNVKKISLFFIPIFISLVLLNFQSIRLWIKTVSKVGENYENPQQIKDDLNLIYSGKYKIEFVELYNIEQLDSDSLNGNQENILKKYSESNGSKDVHIYFTDYNKISNFDVRGKEIVTREAVNILYFLTQRKLDEKIKAVDIAYRRNYGFLSMVGTYRHLLSKN